MGSDDTIDHFKGREAKWAALCAFDGMQYSGEIYHIDQASEFIDEVWEFVTQTCEEEGIEPPEKSSAISELQVLIVERYGK